MKMRQKKDDVIWFVSSWQRLACERQPGTTIRFKFLSLNVNFIYIFVPRFSLLKRASCIQLHKIGFHIVNICLFAIKKSVMQFN